MERIIVFLNREGEIIKREPFSNTETCNNFYELAKRAGFFKPFKSETMENYVIVKKLYLESESGSNMPESYQEVKKIYLESKLNNSYDYNSLSSALNQGLLYDCDDDDSCSGDDRIPDYSIEESKIRCEIDKNPIVKDAIALRSWLFSYSPRGCNPSEYMKYITTRFRVYKTFSSYEKKSYLGKIVNMIGMGNNYQCWFLELGSKEDVQIENMLSDENKKMIGNYSLIELIKYFHKNKDSKGFFSEKELNGFKKLDKAFQFSKQLKNTN